MPQCPLIFNVELTCGFFLFDISVAAVIEEHH